MDNLQSLSVNACKQPDFRHDRRVEFRGPPHGGDIVVRLGARRAITILSERARDRLAMFNVVNFRKPTLHLKTYAHGQVASNLDFEVQSKTVNEAVLNQKQKPNKCTL